MEVNVVLYSWSKILAEADRLSDIILIMRSLAWPVPLYTEKQKRIRQLASKDYSGYCFLIDPVRILAAEVSNLDKVNYIKLASKRNYANYLLTGDTTLDCRLVKELPVESQLLTTKNNRISFAYEQGKQ